MVSDAAAHRHTPLHVLRHLDTGPRGLTDPEAAARPAVTGGTDDGVGLVCRGTQLAEVDSELPRKGAHVVRRDGGPAVEERVEPRLLPGPA